jgi:hypothetical protein
MASITRRAFLAGLGAAGVACRSPGQNVTVRSAAAPRTAPPRPGRRPKAFVQIHLYGGLDAVLTTNPSTRREVRADVDIPYEESAIVQVGPNRVGPHLAPVGEALGGATILNGVLVSTVAHPNAFRNICQMRRNYPDRAPLFASVLGSSMEVAAPLDTVYLKVATLLPSAFAQQGMPPDRSLCVLVNEAQGGVEAPSPPTSSLDLFATTLGATRGREAVRHAVERELSRCGSACLAYEVMRDFLRRFPEGPLPLPDPAGPAVAVPEVIRNPGAARFAADFRRNTATWATVVRDIVFLLKHRLTRTILVQAPGFWDSHSDNLPMQAAATVALSGGLKALLAAFASESSPDGETLADEVGVMVSSELGRFPIQNAFLGKDHLPEMPVILFGPGLRPGQFGATDDHMLATPISRSTGRAAVRTSLVPTLDDVAATILLWMGRSDIRELGYAGVPLEFVMA